MYNVIGEMVFSQQYNTKQAHVDVSDLSTGTYFIKVNGVNVVRFVRE